MLYVGLCAGGWQPLGGDANLFLSLALSGCIGLVGVSVGIVSLRGKTERLGWVDWKLGCVLLVGIIIDCGLWNFRPEIVREAKVGDVYTAKVVRIEKFGAFVNLFGNTDGLLHISKISHHRVEKVEDVLKLGDTIDVKVTEIDNKGRINVSAKALLPKPKKEEE